MNFIFIAFVLNAISLFVISGVIHEDLRLFIETNVPKSGKKQKSILGIGDSKIGAAISEEMGMSCMHTGVVPEIIRGIQFWSILSLSCVIPIAFDDSVSCFINSSETFVTIPAFKNINWAYRSALQTRSNLPIVLRATYPKNQVALNKC